MEVRNPRLILALSGLLAFPALAQEDTPVVTDDGSIIQGGQPSGQPEAAPPNRPIPVRPSRAQPPAAQPVGVPNGTGNQPGTQPGSRPPGETEIPQPEGGKVTLSAFSEGVDIRTLVEYVAGTLKVNIAVDPSLAGTVVLNAPVSVPMADLLVLLNALLEQNNFAMTHDPLTGWYRIFPTANVPVGTSPGPLATTVVIRTPNIRASTVKAMLDLQMINQVPRVVAMDDIGIIIATDTPRRLRMIQDLVASVVAEMSLDYLRFELRYVSAADARKRALELIGRAPTGGLEFTGNAVNPTQPRGSLDNLDERLFAAPQGNALIFRGRPDEGAHVRSVLDVIDAPGNLSGKRYNTGTATTSIAAVAETTGLGSVMRIAAQTDPAAQANLQFNPATGQYGLPQPSGGGSRLVVDEDRGVIIYYGTTEQHEEFARLVAELDLGSDVVVIRRYRLKHRKAEEIQELLQALITGQAPAKEGEGGLLPSAGSSPAAQPRPTGIAGQAIPEGAGISLEGSDNMFVIADATNNQVLVRAPLKIQDQFSKLIQELDHRLAQAYLQAQVVAVTWTDTQRLAFETQLINAAGHGGALQTNFGLSAPATGGTFVDPRLVATGLAGITGAVIRSEYVPIIINALTTEADGRVLSSPRLLVNDNKKATLDSKDLQPTTRLSQGDQSTIQSFDGYQEAGTILVITPQISDGYINLDLEIELSSFTGPATDILPPPKQENKITAERVSVPDGRTVVVGGITLDSETNRVRKIPILGDLPGFGVLFRDTQIEGRSTTLYVFLTPRIVGESNFEDLSLMAKGPQDEVSLSPNLPEIPLQIIPILPTPIPAETGARPGEVRREGRGG